MGPVVITTERMMMRQMMRDDVRHLMHIFADPVAMRYYPSTMNDTEALAWIENTQRNYRQYGTGFWVLEERQSGRFLGQCGLIPQELDGVLEREIAYLLVRDEWGRGYATEAARACQQYGFQTLGLSRLISLIDVRNVPSARVAERIGMTLERTITKWDKAVWVYSCSSTQT